MPNKLDTAVFGGGCFWCTEAVFSNLKGIVSVVPGYAGGPRPNPAYEDVSRGETGHAEVIRIEYDSSRLSYETLLEVFFATHDPTTPNQQGADLGPQYRSVIFYTSPLQKKIVEDFLVKLENENSFDTPIVTEIKPLDKFYEAEHYHQNYLARNPGQPYCQAVISPKLAKFRKSFADLLKK